MAPVVAFAVAGVSVEGAVDVPATGLVPPVMARLTLSPAAAPAPHVLRSVTRPPTANVPFALWVIVPSAPSLAVTVAVHVPVGGLAGTV